MDTNAIATLLDLSDQSERVQRVKITGTVTFAGRQFHTFDLPNDAPVSLRREHRSGVTSVPASRVVLD